LIACLPRSFVSRFTSADGAEQRGVFTILQLSLELPIARPGASHAPGDAGVCDHFHQPCAVASPMLRQARVKIGGQADIVLRMSQFLVEVNQVDGIVLPENWTGG
jgi:hypothetical protein